MLKKSKRPKAIVIIFLIAAAWLVYTFYTHFIEPKRVILQAMGATENIKSFFYTAALDIGSLKDAEWKWNFLIDGNYSNKGESPYIFGSLSLDVKSPNPKFSINSLKADIVTFEQDVVYIKFANAIQASFFDLKNLKDQWIQFDSRNMQKTNTLTSERVQMLYGMMRDSYTKSSFIRLKKLPSEKILGQNSYHYALAMSKKEFEGFMKYLSDAISQSDIEMPEKAMSKKYLDIVSQFIGSKEALGEIWIGKKDLYPRKFFIQAKDSGSVKDGFGASFTLSLKDFNTKDFSAIYPKEYISLEEAFFKAFGRDMKDLLPERKNSDEEKSPSGEVFGETDTDNDALPDFLEKRIGTDMYNPDTDGDGTKDGEEFERGENPLTIDN